MILSLRLLFRPDSRGDEAVVKKEIEFLAQVYHGGVYYWERDMLKSSVPQPQAVMEPFNGDSGLFVELSRLGPSHEAILEFATRYGPAADYFGEWKDLIAEMRKQVEAWQKGKAPPSPLRLDDIPASISIIPEAGDYKVRIVLRSLAMLLKTQCALAIIGGATLRNCQVCDRPFLLFPPFSRSTRVYCSRACKTAAFRQRQEQQDSQHVTTKKRKPQTKGAGRRRSPKDK
jgi:hypothetical protein